MRSGGQGSTQEQDGGDRTAIESDGISEESDVKLDQGVPQSFLES